jgi:hypothetical protein
MNITEVLVNGSFKQEKIIVDFAYMDDSPQTVAWLGFPIEMVMRGVVIEKLYKNYETPEYSIQYNGAIDGVKGVVETRYDNGDIDEYLHNDMLDTPTGKQLLELVKDKFTI